MALREQYKPSHLKQGFTEKLIKMKKVFVINVKGLDHQFVSDGHSIRSKDRSAFSL